MKRKILGTFFISTLIGTIFLSLAALVFLSDNGDFLSFDKESYTLTLLSKNILLDKDSIESFASGAKSFLKSNHTLFPNFSEIIKNGAETLSRSAAVAFNNFKNAFMFLVSKNT